MPKAKMEAEAAKIRNIKGLHAGKIGFITVHGCEEYDNEYDCITGAMLYE